MSSAPDIPRPLGAALPGWTAPPLPSRTVLQGQYVRLEPLEAERHAATLFNAFNGHDWLWDYMGYGPFHSAAQYHRWVRETVASDDHLFFALLDRSSGQPLGVLSYLRMAPAAGSIELGNICIAPVGQGSRATTEAMYLAMKWAFEAGYRRFEWKCDALNTMSRRAAQRLGLTYEGIFRQAVVVKGRNRDTAWFAAIDTEWPALEAAFQSWLARSNFTPDGQQIERLSDLTRLVRAGSDPGL